MRPQQYTGPLRRGWWLQPHTTEELAELLALGVVKAEALQAAPGAFSTLSSHLALLQHADNEGMDTTKRPLLTLVCPSCGATFPSAMQMDPRTFEGIRISNLLECCPKCSRVSRFNRPDYLFRSPG